MPPLVCHGKERSKACPCGGRGSNLNPWGGEIASLRSQGQEGNLPNDFAFALVLSAQEMRIFSAGDLLAPERRPSARRRERRRGKGSVRNAGVQFFVVSGQEVPRLGRVNRRSRRWVIVARAKHRMRQDADRRTVEGGNQRRDTVERRTPPAETGSAGSESTPSPCPESVDRDRQTRRRVLRGPKAEHEETTPNTSALPAWLVRLGYHGLALLLVAIGAVVRMGLVRLMGPDVPLYTAFYPFVMLAALAGGWGPGLVATLATAVVVDYWLLPPVGFKVESPIDIAGLVFFVVMGIFVSIVAELYRRMRDHLEDLVILRTTALNQANEHLQERGEQLQTQTEKLTAVNAELRESEEKYRSIVETATEAVVMVDAQARIIFVNDRWSEIFGYSREESLRMSHFDLVFPEDVARMKERWESRQRGQKESYELRLRRKDGSPVWALIGVAPKFGPQGEFLGTLVMVADITEGKKAEEALRELNATLESKVAQRTQELEQRARQLQKLTLDLTEAEERERERIAEILHDDLQQVLAAAKFQVGLLGNRVRNDADSQKRVGQTKDLLADAIAKSRSLSHELRAPALSQSDLGAALEWLAEQMHKKHGFTVHLETGARIEVASEPLRILLYKAAQELLFNAIKHAGVQEARLRLRRHGGCIGLSVSDWGRGFDPAHPDYHFGFGLLSIRERIERLGGRLKIRSAPGRGSTFFVVVPEGEAVEIVPGTETKVQS
jgi:PAS domain S-box-containing protein